MSLSLPILTLPLNYSDGRPVGHGMAACDAETSDAVWTMLDGLNLSGQIADLSADARVNAYVYAVDRLADGLPTVDAVRLAWSMVKADAVDAFRRAARSDSLDGVGPTALDIPDARPTAPDSLARYGLADLLADASTLAARDSDMRRAMVASTLLRSVAVWTDGRGQHDSPRLSTLSAAVGFRVTEADARQGMADAGEAVHAARMAWQARQTGQPAIWTEADSLAARLAYLSTVGQPVGPSATPIGTYGSGPASVVTVCQADARQPHPMLDPYAVGPWQGDATDDASPTRDADRFATRDAWRPGPVRTPSRRSGRRGQTGPTVPVRLSR